MKHLISFAAMFKNSLYILIITGILLVTGCSRFNKLVKEGTPDDKYKAAQQYYDKGDYYHALQLYEELIVVFRGNTKIKNLYYHYAYAHYYEKDYVLASYHFKYFAKTFPRDTNAQESLYMSAYCKYLLSAHYNLDQASTIKAIQEMQAFINAYPNSDKVAEANKIMDELRAKLIKKDFEISKLYYQTEYYRAAVSSLNQHIKDYPSSPYKEECMYLIIKANYDYASKSILKKQRERYNNTIIAYNDYISKFPAGIHSKDALKIFRNTQQKINKLDTN